MNEAETMDIVMQVGEMSFEGNIIPQSWFEHLKYPSGKPYLTAIVILSEIVYWFRPREIRDERTGRPICYEKKFKGDALQRSYESFANQFGFTKREATDAIKYLVSEGIIRTELRTVTFDNKFKFPNVMFIIVVPECLREITHGRRQNHVPVQRRMVSEKTEEVLRSNGGQSSVSAEDTFQGNGGLSDNLPEDPVRPNGRYADGETEEVFHLGAATSPVGTDAPPPPKRNTNIESNKEIHTESGRDVRDKVFSAEDELTLPGAARGEVGRRRFPRTVELARWCQRKMGRPMFPLEMPADQLEPFEEALDRLEGVTRACGQTAEEVITTRIWLRPEVQAQLREAQWPYTIIARQLNFALEDFSARAVRQKDYTPVATRRRVKEKPEWMSDEEWAFYEGQERE
ncbi:MAG: hypothetical protein ACYDCO_23645 [Armatimonadota bacterium]